MIFFLQPIAFFIMTVILQSSSLAQLCRERQRHYSNTGQDGIIFLDNVLFKSPARSKIHCATLCQSVSGCVTFTYTPSAESHVGSCIGYAVNPSELGTHILDASAKTYALNKGTWLGLPCIDRTDCPVTNSECFKCRCLCTPGYYYSHRGQSCLEECVEADLRTSYIHYPNASIWENQVDWTTGMTSQQCQDWCSAVPWCRSAKYGRQAGFEGWCWLLNVTPRDVPADWHREDPDDLYHKTCI